eukprot:117226-Hanusia_phi.AAC.1
MEEVVDDVVTLVHLSAGVGVDQVGKLLLPPHLLHLRAVHRSSLGAGQKFHVQVQDRHRLPDLAAEGAGLELVDLEREGRAVEVLSVALLSEHEAAEAEDGVGRWFVFLDPHAVAACKGTGAKPVCG